MGEEKLIAPSTMPPEALHSGVAPLSKDGENCHKSREVRQPFPCKVYEMLEDADEKGFSDIVSWNKEGNGFTVHNKDRFTKEIVPKYFNQTRYKSFQRQLSLYGFERATIGSIKGLRFHDKLRRGYPDLCRKMKPVGYKPRGQPKPYQGTHSDASSAGSEYSKNMQTTNVPMPVQPLPNVVSSESIYKDTLAAPPTLVTTMPAPSSAFGVPQLVKQHPPITERLVTTDAVAVFEGMPFYLMTTLPEAGTTIPSLPATADGVVDGQMKKAWDIGFAVAMTMNSPLIPATEKV